MALSVYDVLEFINGFDENLSNTSVNRTQTIISHLKKVDKLNFRIQDFKQGLDWLNVSKPLTLEHLKGHIVILDFFTYCCINCMHILPDLEVVEEKFPPQSGVVVVGVHSAKFLNEKVTANILSAVLRYNITHPVVNDKDADLWQNLAVSCWPTLVFVGPQGQLIYSLAGEGHRSWILEFLDVATKYYSSQMKHSDIPLALEKDKVPVSKLSFPGKVCLWPEHNWIVISDTGNHRIVVTDALGVVQVIIGSGHHGLKDGSSAAAEFSSPQGVACDKTSIYVADTGNHCLRKIDMEHKSVLTIAGTGTQGTDKEGGKENRDQPLASPWDVVLGAAPDDGSPRVLFVAMAGTHQIWVYFLTNNTWYHGRSYSAGTCVCFAGNGREENRNNRYPENASFAQPSGLALSKKDNTKRLYVADSESSSIRAVSLVDCSVTGLVGGERDPMNLFAFGDADGNGVQAKLQHPLGVAYLDGKLVVADSYNHKVKLIALDKNTCTTYAGRGHPGSTLDKSDLRSCEFNEPGGVAVDEHRKLIYIADTNNHAIKVIDYVRNSIFQLPVVFPVETELNNESKTDNSSSQQRVQEFNDKTKNLPDITVPASSHSVTLTVPVWLSEGTHINMDAPNSWKSSSLDDRGQLNQKGKLHSFIAGSENLVSQASLTFTLPQNITPRVYTLRITTQTFLCLDEGDACLPPTLTDFKQVLILT